MEKCKKIIIVVAGIVIIIGIAVLTYIKFVHKSVAENEFSGCFSVGETNFPGGGGLIYFFTPFPINKNTIIIKAVLGEDVLIGTSGNLGNGIWTKSSKGFNRGWEFFVSGNAKNKLTDNGGIAERLNTYSSMGVSISKPKIELDRASGSLNLTDFDSVKKSPVDCK
ncbi:MAG: hypothetical protein NTZ87_00955 [Candidatus Nomurabacteria bacterium]|nr:hypothetical protein [Candidatus Nomurabacteria bacterium]